jgi:hypothetical protein
MAQSRFEKYYGEGADDAAPVVVDDGLAPEATIETDTGPIHANDNRSPGDRVREQNSIRAKFNMGGPLSADESSAPVSRREKYYGAMTEPVPEPEVAPEEPGLLDQFIAGGYEMMARFDAEAALEAAEAHGAHEKGEDFYGPRSNYSISSMMRDYEGKRDPEKTAEHLQTMIDSYSERMAKAEEVPFSPSVQKFLDDDSENTVWEDFAAAPIDIVLELGVRSGPNMVPGLIAGIAGGAVAGPAGFAVGMGAGSARIEYAAAMVEGLQQEGVDLTDAHSIIEAVNNKELMHKVQKRATIRAAAIGSVDALTGGAATKVIGPTGKGILAREITNLAAQAGIQTAGGAGGELLAQVGAGDEISGRQIAAEAAGELVTAPVDVVGAAVSGVREARADSAAETLDAMDQAELDARQRSADEGGDALDQVEAAQGAINDIDGDGSVEADVRTRQEADQAALQEEIDAEAQADADFAETPEGRVLTLEEELIAENNEVTAKRIAQQKAIQRLADAGMAVEEGSQLDAAIQAEIEAETAQAEEAQATADEATATREAAQKAVQERVDNINKVPGQPQLSGEARHSAAGLEAAEKTEGELRAADQAEAAERYEKGTGAKRAMDETTAEVAAGEEAEAVARDFTGEPQTDQPVNPAMREALQSAGAVAIAEVDAAAQEAQTSVENELPQPTEQQIEAGNYKKGHVNLQGMSISIENPKGSTRSSKPGARKEWSQEMKHHYGYIRRTEGADGDQIDTFIGEAIDSPNVFVVDQIDQQSGNFDEHKVMVGFKSPAAAKRGYLQNYEAGWKAGPMTQMSSAEFRNWLKTANTKQPISSSTPIATASQEAITEAETVPTRGMRARQGEPVTAEPGAVDVQGEVTRLSATLPNVKATVVATADDLPSNLAGEARRRTGVRALYDVESDQVYVVADQHTSPEEVEKTMLHEGVAHKGLRYVMNSGELANMLDGVAKTANLTEIATKYKLDLSDTAQAQEAAEEYIAQMAESGSNQGVVSRVIAAVRSALRKAGMVGAWTDNDIKSLLREAHKEMAGTPAQRTMLSVEAEVEGTGETVTIERPADVMIRQHDKRANVIEQLRTCIG